MKDHFTILVAEDNLGHFFLTKRVLENSGIFKEIVHLSDGQKTVDFLTENCTGFDHKDYLLLLDISMPKVDGLEILEWMKSNPFLQNIPVVVISTCCSPENIARCKELGCDDYIAKPLRPKNLIELIESWTKSTTPRLKTGGLDKKLPCPVD